MQVSSGRGTLCLRARHRDGMVFILPERLLPPQTQPFGQVFVNGVSYRHPKGPL